MQLKHLTDEEIQDFLDGNLTHERTLLVEKHLETCARCREALRQYQSLYLGLRDDRGFELSKGFARSVIRKLPAEGETESRFRFLNLFLAILGFVVCLGALTYYADLRPLGRAFSHILPRPEFGAGILDLIEGLLVGLNGNLGLLTFAILALLLVAGLDRLILQPRHRRISW
jgi:hypothetical protein